MRQFELVDRGQIRWNPDAPVPAVGPDQVLVRVHACTVCNRSDLVYFYYRGLREHCAAGCFGHEISGVVEEAGPAVRNVRPGRRVFVRTPLTSGFADYALAREVSVGILPENIPFAQGAILQLLPLAVHATRGVRLGDRVAIIGQGPVGLMALQVVRLRGAAGIVVADLDAWRLLRSSALGADECVEVDGSAEQLRSIGADFDVAIDAVGTPRTARACVDVVTQGGLVVFLGTHHVDTRVTFDLVQWEKKGLRVHSSAEPTDAVRTQALGTAVRLVEEHRIRVAELLTHTYTLEELPSALARLSDSGILAPAGEDTGCTGPPHQVLKIAICP
ncbi:zinc-binding dehydrogenase [Streptomyces sp. NPDC057424]|uniref:zinc-dependent alcohol dehydrogenase n=1 Tax=Streptomyces sp. NPDC057424 TaxID=3346127 RepID=UPI0036A2F8A4